jgi:hypothetical protein
MTVTTDLLSGNLKSVSEDVSLADTPATASVGAMTLHVSVAYSDMPSGTAIVAPSGATDIGSLITASLNSARGNAQDARVIADVNEFRTQLESDYDGKSYADVKSANTIPTTGNYVTLAQDVAAQTSVLGIKTNAKTPFTAYAIYGRLVSDPTKYFCVDSTGHTVEAGPLPTGDTCK